MSKARELLKRFMHELTKEELCSVPDELQAEIEELLDQPEEGVYQKLLRIEDGVEVEILPSELWQDGYEAGKRSVLLSKQPEQHGTQYLLDQVARLTAENAMLKEKWLSQPEPLTPRQGLAEYKRGYAQAERDLKREPLGEEESYHEAKRLYEAEDGLWYEDGFVDGLKFAEKMHGIGGE